MASKKQNETLLIVGAIAVVGYLAFRSGGFLNKPAVNAALPVSNPGIAVSNPQISNPNDIAVDLPNLRDIGIYSPSLDPTGSSITLY